MRSKPFEYGRYVPDHPSGPKPSLRRKACYVIRFKSHLSIPGYPVLNTSALRNRLFTLHTRRTPIDRKIWMHPSLLDYPRSVRMLDKSFWLTAKVLEEIKRFKISSDCEGKEPRKMSEQIYRTISLREQSLKANHSEHKPIGVSSL
jgi:hypothetical protein